MAEKRKGQGDKTLHLLKPTLQWKTGPAPAAKAPAPKPVGPKGIGGAGLGANSRTQAQFTREQLVKMAESRGISLEKLIAQMVAQYLAEDKKDQGPFVP